MNRLDALFSNDTVNWAGVVMGVSLALALLGAMVAAFSSRRQSAVLGLSAAMFGVAGVSLALGNDYMAIVIAVVLGAGVPAVMLLAMAATPPMETDFKPGPRAPLVGVLLVAMFAGLALVMIRARWAPSSLMSQNTVEWIGSRFLTDHLFTLDLVAALLAVAACGAVALLRGRIARRP